MSKPINRHSKKALPHVVSALIQRRGLIAGQIEDLQRQLKIAVIELDNLESTIRIFDPSIDLSLYGPRPVPPPHAAFRGELSRILIDALKGACAPLSTGALAEIVMRERGMSVEDLKARRVMLRRVGAALNNWKRVKKVLKSMPGPGDMLVWQIDRERIAQARIE